MSERITFTKLRGEQTKTDEKDEVNYVMCNIGKTPGEF